MNLSTKRESDKNNKQKKTVITKVLNFIHIVVIFFPYVLFCLSNNIINKYFKPYLKYILLIYILIPLHWPFFDNKCVFTKISMMFGDYSDAKTNAQFSEQNIMWILKPLLNIFGWDFNNNGMKKVLTLLAFVNIFIIWMFI